MKKVSQLTEGQSIIFDLIRGVSSQAVVVGHALSIYKLFQFAEHPDFLRIHNLAVAIFFIISGYLIVYSTSRKKQKPGYNFTLFSIDRFSRIYVAYFPALVFVFALDFLSIQINPETYIYPDHFSLKHFIGNVFMLQDFPVLHFLGIETFGTAEPFWTLPIEWFMYLFYGFFTLIFVKQKMSIKNIIILAFLLIVPVVNAYNGRGNGLTVVWFFGAICYLLQSHDLLKGVKRSSKIFILFLALFLFAYRFRINPEEYDALLAFFMTLGLFVALDLFKNSDFKNWFKKLIRLNANYSYTLYLVHFTVLAFIKAHFTGNKYVLFAIGIVVANIVAYIIAQYTELVLTQKVKSYLTKRATNQLG